MAYLRRVRRFKILWIQKALGSTSLERKHSL
jgi:hypothetical protein